MSNSHVITSNFEFIRPDSLDNALEHLKKDNVKILAGGTDLINLLKDDRITPDAVLFIGDLPELKKIDTANGLNIGSAVVMDDVEKNETVQKNYPALAEAVNSVGGWQVRNTATITGNICNASPGADTVPALVALGAEVVIKSKDGGEKKVLVEDFMTGPGKTAITAGELVTSVAVPAPAAGSSSAFMRMARVTLDVAKLNCAVWIQLDGDVCKDVRIAIGSVAPTVVRGKNAEAVLKDQKVTSELIKKAADESVKDISPISDVRSTKEYRNQVVPVAVLDALEKAVARVKGA